MVKNRATTKQAQKVYSASQTHMLCTSMFKMTQQYSTTVKHMITINVNSYINFSHLRIQNINMACFTCHVKPYIPL